MFYPNLSESAKNVTEKVLRCAFAEMFPFWDVKVEKNGFDMNGPMLDILESITKGLDMKAYLGTPSDRQWGQRIKEKPLTFNGAIGMVQRGEVDLFLGPSGIIAERLLVANPYPYFFGYTTMLVPAPRKYIDPFSYVKTFVPEVWMGIFLSWIIVSATICFLNGLSPEPGSFKAIKRIENTDLGNYIWDYFQYLLQSYGNREVNRSHERALLSFYLLSNVVIIALLSGELTTTLLLKNNEDFVDRVDDLLRFPKLRIAAERGSAPERFFNSPNHPVFRRLQPRLRSIPGIMTNRSVAFEILDQIDARKAVLAAPLSYLMDHWPKENPEMYNLWPLGLLNDRYISHRSGCRYHIIEHHLALTSVGLFFNRNFSSITRRAIEKRVSYHIDHSILINSLETRMINYTKCLFKYQEQENTVDALLLSDLEGLFVLFSIGICASISCVVSELFCKRKTKIGSEIRSSDELISYFATSSNPQQ